MRRTEYSWDRLALEAAGRMAEHDALPVELRELSNEEGLAVAKEVQSRRQADNFLALFA